MFKGLEITVIYNDPTMIEPKTEVYDSSITEIRNEIEFITNSLENAGFKVQVLPVYNARKFINDLLSLKTNLIYNFCEMVELESSEEIFAAGLYELLKIPYTGAPPMTLGLCLDKAKTKIILSHYKIPTAKFEIFNESLNGHRRIDLNFPLIVKPLHEDASTGINEKSVVYEMKELEERVEFITKMFKQPALVEEFIDGREVNVAILGNKPPIVLPISEIDFSQLPSHLPKIVTYEAKWIPNTDYYEKTIPICPAPLDPELERKIKEIALSCYNIMGCRDYARVDMRIDKNGNPYVLEVNPNPDLSRNAGFMRSASVYGLTPSETIVKIAEIALERIYENKEVKK
ncbi:D-alanine-D-alanine ligase [Candidatus Kryptobacter tengchongensis]|uniref:D-alanine-D-alanine ligase n=1 Tax=Kryptobacter tengchongensis TaxID=1643429 RepID=A0A656D6C2_KRYT1|nr:ATP-grasp domain-containing protein [Candidatus Kryptobacter tengchongensis]CUS99546.1 D-alanine-D-alanine ligase [Candidatus Kryptobacter tengchongensis]CUU05309.1 D-alanine-D-alanine ligase [Candidatus Kryptobacter tengchongensis]